MEKLGGFFKSKRLIGFLFTNESAAALKLTKSEMIKQVILSNQEPACPTLTCVPERLINVGHDSSQPITSHPHTASLTISSQ